MKKIFNFVFFLFLFGSINLAILPDPLIAFGTQQTLLKRNRKQLLQWSKQQQKLGNLQKALHGWACLYKKFHVRQAVKYILQNLIKMGQPELCLLIIQRHKLPEKYYKLLPSWPAVQKNWFLDYIQFLESHFLGTINKTPSNPFIECEKLFILGKWSKLEVYLSHISETDSFGVWSWLKWRLYAFLGKWSKANKEEENIYQRWVFSASLQSLKQFLGTSKLISGKSSLKLFMGQQFYYQHLTKQPHIHSQNLYHSDKQNSPFWLFDFYQFNNKNISSFPLSKFKLFLAKPMHQDYAHMFIEGLRHQNHELHKFLKIYWNILYKPENINGLTTKPAKHSLFNLQIVHHPAFNDFERKALKKQLLKLKSELYHFDLPLYVCNLGWRANKQPMFYDPLQKYIWISQDYFYWPETIQYMVLKKAMLYHLFFQYFAEKQISNNKMTTPFWIFDALANHHSNWKTKFWGLSPRSLQKMAMFPLSYQSLLNFTFNHHDFNEAMAYQQQCKQLGKILFPNWNDKLISKIRNFMQIKLNKTQSFKTQLANFFDIHSRKLDDCLLNPLTTN